MSNIKLITFPIVLVISIMVIWFFAKPLFDEARSLNQIKMPQLESLLQEESDLQQRTGKLASQTGDADQTEAISNAIPTDKDVNNLVSQIEFIVKKENMTLTSLSVKDVSSSEQSAAGLFGQTGSAYQNIDGDFEVMGSYGQFKQFLRDIRKLNRLVNIEAIDISNTSSEEGGGGATGKYIVNFSAYWQPAITPEQVKAGLESKEMVQNSPALPGIPGLPVVPTP